MYFTKRLTDGDLPAKVAGMGNYRMHEIVSLLTRELQTQYDDNLIDVEMFRGGLNAISVIRTAFRWFYCAHCEICGLATMDDIDDLPYPLPGDLDPWCRGHKEKPNAG